MARKVSQLAKLSRPGLFGATPRERLFSRLDQLKRHPLIWISGPPGAGKTTLIASWLGSRRLKGIWYQVDSGDADVSTFFYYLGIATRTIAPRQQSLPLLTPEYLPDLQGFVRRYFRELFSRMPQSGVLVLDNCHHVNGTGKFWEVIQEAASEIAPGRNIVIIERGDTTARFSSLVANQVLARLDWTDLRLTPEETAAILAAKQIRDPGTLSELHGRSAGWAAGLILMLDRAVPRTSAFDRGAVFGQQAVFDYFADQVFDHATLETQTTLLSVAFLPTSTADEAEVLSGNTNAGRLLDSLYRRQMFVDRHDGPEPRFRLHDLFREFLLARIRIHLSAAEAKALRRKAAKLLEVSSTPDHAFTLYIEADDPAAAAMVALANAQRLVAEGRWHTLRTWISKLPTDAVQERPWLRFWKGIAEAQVDQSCARATLSETYDAFESRGDVIGQMSTAAGILTGFYFEYVDWKPADVWIDRLGKLLEQQPELPNPELSLSVYSAMLYGIAIRQTNHPMLARCVDRTLSLLRSDADINARLQGGMAITGPVACMLGAFDLFRIVRQTLAPLLADPRVTELNRACWHMTCGAKLSFDCEYEDAFQELETAARLAQEHNLRQVEFLSHHFEGLHAICYFDIDKARKAFTRSRELVDLANPLQRAYMFWGHAEEAFALGNATVALEKSRQAKAAGDSIGSAAHSVIGSVFLGGALILNELYDEADEVAKSALIFSKHQQIPTWDATLTLVLAWSQHERGDPVETRKLLSQALDRGKDGSATYFRWLFHGARKMLELALTIHVDEQHVQTLLRRFRYCPTDPLLMNWPWPVRVWTLGRFRIDVDDEPLAFGRKVPKRPLGLLQCLIALGGKDIPEHRLMDALWPDADGDEAHSRLGLALHRLRQLLGGNEFVRLQGGKVSLDTNRIWIDALALEAALSDPSYPEPLGKTLALYPGDFLATEHEEPWMLPIRERLRRLIDRHLNGKQAASYPPSASNFRNALTS